MKRDRSASGNVLEGRKRMAVQPITWSRVSLSFDNYVLIIIWVLHSISTELEALCMTDQAQNCCFSTPYSSNWTSRKWRFVRLLYIYHAVKTALFLYFLGDRIGAECFKWTKNESPGGEHTHVVKIQSDDGSCASVQHPQTASKRR